METSVVHFLASRSAPKTAITVTIRNNNHHHNHSTVTRTQPLPSLPRRGRSLRINSGDGTINDDTPQPAPAPPTITPPDTVEIRFRRGSRKRNRQLREEGVSNSQTLKAEAPTKKWEDMNLSEKATELYMGEKGLLFWLNKFAYASIFIVIGGWIVFRFVGPALNLYQLDAPPLPPSSMFKGS